MDLTPHELEVLQQAFAWSRSGEVELLRQLLDAGCPVNLTNDRGDTLLILAAYHAQEPVVELLLSRDADVDRVNDNGQTALGAAVFRRESELVRRLLAAGAGVDVGPRSARDVARFFALDEMRVLIGDLPPTAPPAPPALAPALLAPATPARAMPVADPGVVP